MLCKANFGHMRRLTKQIIGRIHFSKDLTKSKRQNGKTHNICLATLKRGNHLDTAVVSSHIKYSPPFSFQP